MAASSSSSSSANRSPTYDRIIDLQQQLNLATEFMNRSSTQKMLVKLKFPYDYRTHSEGVHGSALDYEKYITVQDSEILPTLKGGVLTVKPKATM